MTAPLLPWVYELPADRHTTALREVLEGAARVLPGAGLAVSGSLAQGRHGAHSDIDLLMVDAAFRRDMHFSWSHRGIGVVAVCMRPAPEALRAVDGSLWALGGGAAYVVNARCARDPAGALQSVQRELLRLRDVDEAFRQARQAALRARSRALLGAAGGRAYGPAAALGAVLADLFAALLQLLALEHRVPVHTKEHAFGLLDEVERRDPRASVLLRDALPLRRESLQPLSVLAARLAAIEQGSEV